MSTIDTSQLRELAQQFERAAQAAPTEVRKVVSRGALNIKRAWRTDIEGSAHFNRRGRGGRGGDAGRSVSYDLRRSGNTYEAEIGPDKSRSGQAALLNIAHFGGANGGGGTLNNPQAYLDAEAPSFEDWMARAVDGLL